MPYKLTNRPVSLWMLSLSILLLNMGNILALIHSPPTSTVYAQTKQEINNVGQNNDKQTTQDEPNSTEDPNSPAFKDEEPAQNTSATPATPATTPRASSTSTTTVVAGDQDMVETNPQNQVGGIEEVNQLFKEDSLGSQPVEVVQTDRNYLPYILMALVILALIPAVLLVKKTTDQSK